MDGTVLISILIILVTMWTTHVAADVLDRPQDELLTEFMRLQSNFSNVNWNKEKTVELLRNVLVKRIRCGSQSIHKKICEDCLSIKRIQNIVQESHVGIDNRSQQGANITKDLGRLSVVFLNFFLSFQTSCTVESIQDGYVGSCRVYDQCWSELLPYMSSMNSTNVEEILETIEKLLREVKAVYEPEPSRPCFSAEKIFQELNSRSEKFKSLPREISTILLITSHLLSGECIDVGESVADFLDDIFLHYGDGCERVITQSGFAKLWNDLQMQRKGKHINHGVQKDSCYYQSTEQYQNSETKIISNSQEDHGMNTMDNNHSKTIIDALISTEVMEHNLSTTTPRFSTESDTISTSDHRRSKPSTSIRTAVNIYTVLNASSGITSSPNIALLTEEHSTVNSEGALLTDKPQNADVYLVGEKNGITGEDVKIVPSESNLKAQKRKVRHTSIPEDHEHKNLANECLPSDDLLRRFLTNGNKVITSSEFLQLCPALVQQAVSGVCNARLMASSTTTEHKGVRAENATDITLEVALKSGNPWYAVASVTLITVASFLGLFTLPIRKKSSFHYVSAFFTGLAFGTMSGDVVLHIMPQYLGLHKHDHEHGQDGEEESMVEKLFPSHLQRQLAFLLTMYVLFITECIFSTLTGEAKEHHGHSHGSVEISLKTFNVSSDVENADASPKSSRGRRIIEFFKPSNLYKDISSKALVILLADTVHNFADGMAIAVGYTTSNKDGISTSIAVFFHELPHEIGDFAILMSCGLGYWKAFFFNVISGFSAFIGLGVGVFTASVFREWLLCITAGLFFFVVMVEMLPDMRLQSRGEWRIFATKIIGTISGIIAMIGIAMYELSGA